MSADSFADTGLAEPLVAALDALGLDRPTALQAAALPIVRRGGNLLLRGSAGSGVTLAWAAGVLERAAEIEPATPRVLVLTRDVRRAAYVADALATLAAAAPPDSPYRALTVGAGAPGWRDQAVDLLALPVRAAATAMGASRLKVDGAGIVVIENATALLEHAGEAVDAVLAAVPRDAQRILVTVEWSDAVERLAESAAKRALHVPPRPADASAPAATRTVAVAYVPESDKLNALCELLAQRTAAEDVVVVRSRARARWLADELAMRGYGSEDGPAVVAAQDAAQASIAWDVPFDAEALATIGGAHPVVFATPEERAHLRAIAQESGTALQARTSAPPPAGEGYRARIEAALEEEDIDAQMALLAPLFERRSPVEIAAALSALLRRKPVPQPVAAPAPRAPRFVRLFISAGQRDGLRPADLLGAITGESGIAGERVGRLDIRDTFSVAEVGEDEADRVIQALNGTTLRGRALRVDYDRRSGGGGGGASGTGPRRRAPRV